MDDNARQLSLALENVSKALAEWTVSAHEERDPTLPVRYGPRWRQQWVDEVRSRLAYLAQALAVRKPIVFAEALRWSGVAFMARRLGENDLSLSHACLREVIESNLPKAIATPIMQLLNDAEGMEISTATRAQPVTLEQPHGELVLRYLEALLEGKRHRAEAIILDAAKNGTPVDDLYLQVLQPAMTEIGRMWHLNEVTVADEHFATTTTEAVMARLRAFGAAPKSLDRRVVATSISGELHSIGVRMVADFFEMAGWQTMLLGANMPARDIVECLVHKDVHLLAVSATSTLHLRNLGDLIQLIRSSPEVAGLPIIVGGEPFRRIPGLAEELGASGTATSAKDAVALGKSLLDMAAPAS